MPESIQSRSLHYLEKKLKHARIALGKAEQKKGAESEIEGLKNKIDVLEWLTEIALKEG